MHATTRTRLSIVLSLDPDEHWHYVAPSGHVFLIQQVILAEFPLDLDAEPDDLDVVRVYGQRINADGSLGPMALTGWAVHWVDVPGYIREDARLARRHEARRLWRLWVRNTTAQPRS